MSKFISSVVSGLCTADLKQNAVGWETEVNFDFVLTFPNVCDSAPKSHLILLFLWGIEWALEAPCLYPDLSVLSWKALSIQNK